MDGDRLAGLLGIDVALLRAAADDEVRVALGGQLARAVRRAGWAGEAVVEVCWRARAVLVAEVAAAAGAGGTEVLRVAVDVDGRDGPVLTSCAGRPQDDRASAAVAAGAARLLGSPEGREQVERAHAARRAQEAAAALARAAVAAGDAQRAAVDVLARSHRLQGRPALAGTLEALAEGWSATLGELVGVAETVVAGDA